MTDKTLRLVLGDQLNAAHSWFQNKDENVIYLLAELGQEATYVKHHVQKLLAFSLAMERFATALNNAGHEVLHLTLDDTKKFDDLPALLADLCTEQKYRRFEYQRPDEFRLSQQLSALRLDNIDIQEVDSEHFLLNFDDIPKYFKAGRAVRMENFYRKLRAQHNILMQGDEPYGGRWNYDAENRKKLSKKDLDEVPKPLVFENDSKAVKARIDKHQISYFGTAPEPLPWPVTRSQALELLDYFCVQALPRFGKFQDAMTCNSEHAWSLYHSRLSFALNVKILHPKTVIDRAIREFTNRPEEIDIAQIEGFVRQILGWREFVRGIYWANMPPYQDHNTLDANRDLPAYFWNGNTKMRCMQQSLGQSLEYAYAHHIQRLMVIGNFCLLAGIDPKQVDNWYLGVYIDAIEWVEMPNTRGMSQFADGGLVASKPYSASGSYINRMSDYCSSCAYKTKEKIGEQACPFNSLYWHFMHRHRDRFGSNPRISMVYRNLDKMETELREATLARGEWVLDNLEKL